MLHGRPAGLKIGAMDTVFRLNGKPDAVRVAKELGMAALQVTLGKSTDQQTLPLENPEVQAAFMAASKEYGVPLGATYLDMLHVNCLKDSPMAPKWIEKGLDITKKLNARILMGVFFNKCAVPTRTELDYVIDRFRELAPHAERAGIVLGFENTNTAEDNCYAIDRVASKAFKVWYDVGNPTFAGFDAAKDIRTLGRDRICAFHFKERGYLGEGKVDMPAILRAIDDIGFQGYAYLETSSPSGSFEADAKRNLTYVQQLMK